MMPFDDATIRVTGIVDLQRALRQMDKDAPKELAAELASVSELVLRKARPKVPHLTGAAQGSMKVKKQQRGAALAVGGSRAEYYPWLDFGGRVGRGGSVRREVIRGGRYIYPTVAENSAEIKSMVDAVLEKMARRAGFEQVGSN